MKQAQKKKKKNNDYRDIVDICNNLAAGAFQNELKLLSREIKELRKTQRLQA